MTKHGTMLAIAALLFLITGCSNDSADQEEARTDSPPSPGQSASATADALASSEIMPEPADEFLIEDLENSEELRTKWLNEIHSSSPDIDWREINQRNAALMAELRPNVAARGSSESFANGQLNGTWVERGGIDQAGAMHQIRYVPATDQIYGFSGLSTYTGGRSLWRGNRDGTGWTVLHDDYLFRPQTLEAFVPSGSSSVRLIVCEDKVLNYSDNEGVNFQAASFDPVMGFEGFGRPLVMGHLPGDTDTVFYLVRTWDPDPWGYRQWMYRSTDAGETFDRIHVFTEGNADHVHMWLPESGNAAFVLEKDHTLHTFTSTSHTTTACSGLPTNGNEYKIAGSFDGGQTLYAMVSGNDIYRSTNGGLNWTLMGPTADTAWDVGFACSPWDADRLFLGAQECYRSYNSGSSWTRVNRWQDYYPDNDFLHADIMDFEFGETSVGTRFVLIANHGGLHISYDDLQTTDNLGDYGLLTGQYYDVLTHPVSTNLMFFGTQDQGWQWTSTADVPGPVSVVQQISGDFGQAQLTRDFQSYWTQYPGGWFFYYPDVFNPTSIGDTFNLDGSNIPSWIIPTAPFKADPAQNAILVGGGNVSGGSGSYLVKLTALDSSPHDITASQYNYDFRANSDSGNGRISAIEQPAHDIDTMYVTTGDGTFFKTNDGGVSWQKATGFQLAPTEWIYTSAILSSKIDPDVIWTSGAGYSNPPVYKSTDGGDTFQPMSNGLPDTLVQEIIANPGETMLFAATDVGPFVYIVADDQWYPMIGSYTPINWYTSLEYIERENLVRFATWGRGTWDFEVAFGTLPVEFVNVTKGTIAGGSPAELEASDNVDFEIRRSSSTLNATVELEGGLTSPTQFPGNVNCTVESSVFARGNVSQTLFMYNYETDSFEQVDQRNASRFQDVVASVDLTGDLTRFVDPVTGMMEFRLRYSAAVQRANFSANIDQIVFDFD